MFARLNDLERAADTLFPASRLPAGDDVLEHAVLSQACSAGVLIVVVCGDDLAGASIALPDGDDLHLLQLAVHPEHGRRGLGRALLAATAQQAAAHWRAITLTTFADLPFNAPFYQRFGFEFLNESEASTVVKDALKAERAQGMTQRVAMTLMLG